MPYLCARAPGAAGKTHSDLGRGFIRAEVTKYDDQIAADGNLGELRKAGKLAVDGKDCEVLDGDILDLRHNTSVVRPLTLGPGAH